jgi:hypothetical protein
MRWKLLLGTGLLQLWLCCAGFSQSPKLEQILPRIQEHVKEFELLLPDFICDETIVSRELAGTFVQHEMVIESTFRGTQHKDEEDRPFTESREIKTVDGHPPFKGQPLNGPFFFGGGFSSILHQVFSQKNQQYYSYKAAGIEKIEGKIALAIKFETKEGQREILYRDISGSRAIVEGKGKAWIDPNSMNVIRLEFEYLNPPLGAPLEVAIDYAPVVINGRAFWMPKTVTAEQTVPNPKHPIGGQYIASYANYHQFNVSVKFKY